MYAKITKIVHRDSEPKLKREASVVDVHYRLNGQTETFTLDNRAWDVRSPWLQFCAVYGWQPTTLSDSTMNVSDRNRYLPMKETEYATLVPDFERIFDGAQDALAESEWFDPDVDVDSSDESVSGVHGGGSPDPGTGNQGAVEYDTDGFDVDAIREELEESDTDVVEV